MNVGKISGSMRNNINTSTATASIAEQWINSSVFRESETGIFEKADKFRPKSISDEFSLEGVLLRITDEPAISTIDTIRDIINNANIFCIYEDGKFVGIEDIIDWIKQNRSKIYFEGTYIAYIEKSTLGLEIKDDYNASSDKGILLIDSSDVEDYERIYLGL